MLFKLVAKKWCPVSGVGSSGSKEGPVAGYCDHNNESVSVEGGQFL